MYIWQRMNLHPNDYSFDITFHMRFGVQWTFNKYWYATSCWICISTLWIVTQYSVLSITYVIFRTKFFIEYINGEPGFGDSDDIRIFFGLWCENLVGRPRALKLYTFSSRYSRFFVITVEILTPQSSSRSFLCVFSICLVENPVVWLLAGFGVQHLHASFFISTTSISTARLRFGSLSMANFSKYDIWKKIIAQKDSTRPK